MWINRRQLLVAALAVLVALAPNAGAQRGAAPPTPPTQADILIPVSDGERLGADIYLPPGQGPFPVLLTVKATV